MSVLSFEVNENIAVIFDAAVNGFLAKTLVVWNANQVDTPAAFPYNLANYLTMFQRNEEVDARHG